MLKREDIEASWRGLLDKEFNKEYFTKLSDFLQEEVNAGKLIYPVHDHIFNAFQLTPFDKVKVVILGQDPYHRQGQAMGLSFSVPKNIKTPRSLNRIYAELQRDLGILPPTHGNLTSWAKQGVFLLNAMLTVEEANPGSHKKIGWQLFTDAVIKKISDSSEGKIFMLWGNFAKKKKSLIDEEKHFILEAAHPSPLAGNAFQGCGHFSKANAILLKLGKKEIDWELSGE